MRIIPHLLLAFVLTGAAAAFVYTKTVKQDRVDKESLAINAAFRDGMYQGKSDAHDGKGPRLTSGRWSADSDRSAFVAGYKSGYEQVADYASGIEPASPTPTWIGFRDGVADGVQHRQQAQLFQGGKTEKYLRGDHGYSPSEGDREEYKAAYQDAYANGYQHGYYGSGSAFGVTSLTAQR